MTEANSEFVKGRRGRWTILPAQLLHYGVALLSVALAVGTNLQFSPYLAPTPTPPFFAAVMVSAWYGGLRPGLLATALSTLAINYFFIEPSYSLNIPNLGTLVQLGVFVMAAILINSLNEAQRVALRRAEANLHSLRESEARFGRLAESNIIGMIVAQLNGPILEANDIFLQMVGYTQQELRSGRVRWREMTAPESREVSNRAVQELTTTGVCTPFETEYIRKDGSRVPVLHGAAMTGETTVIGFVLDLSERKRSEAERKQAEAAQQEAAGRERALYVKEQAAKEQLETVLASINDQFLVLDREWRYTYVNDRVVEVVGMSREDLLGKCIWELFPETVGTQFYIELHRAATEQRIVHFEYFYSSWQRWFENHIYPSATGLSVLVTEITAVYDELRLRKRAEETLERTNQTLQTLIDACPVAIALFDPQGIVKLWNRAAEQIFGWSADEAIGQFMPTIPHRPQEFLASIQSVLSGRSLDGLEAQHQRKDGRMVDLEIWANLTHDVQGNLACLGIAWDITERKQAQAALVAKEQRYRYIFEAVSVAIWEEDFSQVKAAINQLKVAGVRDFHQYFAEHPEFVQQAADMVRVRDVNQAALQMFGAQDKAQLLTSLHQIFVPETQEAFIGELIAIAAEEPFFAAETVLRTLQGDRFHVWVTIAFPSTSESYDRVLVSLLDISERKRVQQELQQTLQTLSTLIQASPLPIVVIEADMTVQLWNAAAEQLFGWSKAELLGQRLPIVPEEKQEECRQLREAVTNGEVFSGVETYCRKRDGSNVILNISAAPLYDEGGSVNAILLILQDITERQQALSALRDSEERLRLALIASNQGLYDLNVQTGDAIVSPEYARMLGYEPDEFQETNPKWRDSEAVLLAADRLHPDDVAVVYQAYEDYVALRRDEYRVEFRQRTKSGDWKWILSIGKIVSWDNQGQPLRMLGTHTDITDRKQAELEIRKFVSLTDNSTDFIGMCDMNGVSFYINAAGRQMVGLDDTRQYNEAPVREFFFPEDQDFIVNEFLPCVLRSGRAEVEIRFRHFKTGEALWMIYNVFYIRGENDQPIGLATVSRNITERKRAEAERERLLVREQAAREQAEAANRIKDEFLAVLSHELRSPLNPILGWAKLLRSRKLDEQKTAQALETIERNANLQTQLIGDLLDVSRILQGKLSLNIAPVDLAATITAAMETVRLAAEAKSIQIHTALDGAIGKVSGDSGRLQQIIWNLLSNAVKFTPEGGRVEVRLERIGSDAQITVSDTGQGISSEFLPYVFDYFRQADGATTRKFGGLGLGLAIVRHLTELHGGTVTAQSLGEEQGATFTVRLPLIKETAGLENEPSPNSSTDELATSPLAGLSILVVDDDADTRDYISFVLEQAGATVICAASADEALQVLVQSTADILLSDIGMPEMDGYMLMRRVRAIPSDRGGQIPAIALTAYAGEMNQQQAIAAGFQRHIAKPVEPEYLIQAITSLSAANAALVRHL